jgi:hypothetical protein
MSIRKMGAVLVAVLALAGILASSASAEVKTEAAEWYTGAAPGATLTTNPGVTAEAAEEAILNGVLLGEKYKLTTSTLECVGCTIKNEEVTEKAGKVAYGEGKIKFTNVVVKEPAGCKVHNVGVNLDGTVETNLLKIHGDFMDVTTTNKHGFIQFLPKTGSVFAGLEFTNKTGEVCPIAGPFNVTGSVFGESTNDTGTQAATQPLNFSAAIQTTTGAALKLGTGTATLTGKANFKTGGTLFGIH